MKKILHIAPDEKFIDYIIENFNKIDLVRNTYIITKEESNFKFIKNQDKVKSLSRGELLSNDFISSLSKFDLILLHGLVGPKIDLVNLSPDKTNFIWLSWGADFYDIHPVLRNKLFLKKTNKLSWKTETKFRIKRLLKPVLSRLGLRKETYLLQEEALKKIKFIAPVIYEDFLIIKKNYVNAENCKFINFAYGDISYFTGNLSQITGSNILLGNSASASNNHIEVLDILKEFNLDHRIVYIPLSYGNRKYAADIERYANKKLMQNYKGLVDFMPIKEYLDIISSCEIVIMNHRRQQGMGNIYAMVYLGAKLFLRKENPAYHFFIRNRIKVFSMEELRSSDSLKPLSQIEKERNKTSISSLLSADVVEKYFKELINLQNNNVADITGHKAK